MRPMGMISHSDPVDDRNLASRGYRGVRRLHNPSARWNKCHDHLFVASSDRQTRISKDIVRLAAGYGVRTCLRQFAYSGSLRASKPNLHCRCKFAAFGHWRHRSCRYPIYPALAKKFGSGVSVKVFTDSLRGVLLSRANYLSFGAKIGGDQAGASPLPVLLKTRWAAPSISGANIRLTC